MVLRLVGRCSGCGGEGGQKGQVMVRGLGFQGLVMEEASRPAHNSASGAIFHVIPSDV